MPRDFIKVDTTVTTATQAGELLNLVRLVGQAYAQGVKVRGIMQHNHDGSNFTDLETLFGLPVGKGQEIFDLVNGAVGSMEGLFQVDDAKELTERVG